MLRGSRRTRRCPLRPESCEPAWPATRSSRRLLDRGRSPASGGRNRYTVHSMSSAGSSTRSNGRRPALSWRRRRTAASKDRLPGGLGTPRPLGNLAHDRRSERFCGVRIRRSSCVLRSCRLRSARRNGERSSRVPLRVTHEMGARGGAADRDRGVVAYLGAALDHERRARAYEIGGATGHDLRSCRSTADSVLAALDDPGAVLSPALVAWLCCDSGLCRVGRKLVDRLRTRRWLRRSCDNCVPVRPNSARGNGARAPTRRGC